MKNEEAKAELVERYLYDVTRRLPEKQRGDIEEELRTLIEDMAEEREEKGETREAILAGVLEELGEPAKLAAKYRGEKAHLIGGEYYSLYCQVLKIVLIGVGIGMGLSLLLNICISATAESVDEWIRFVQEGMIDLGMIPAALLETFGLVTLLFCLMERNQVKLKSQSAWSISKLPQIPYKKAVIKKSDSIAGIIFGVLFIVLFICASSNLGVWIKNASGQLVVIPIFNMKFWHRTMPLLVLCFLMGIVVDLVKLIAGHYNLFVMWVNIGCNAVSLIITCYLFKGNILFNPDLPASIFAIKGEDFFGKYDIMENICLGVIIILLLVEVFITVYRTLRYGLKGNE